MSITKGAGVDPDEIIKPSKRLRNWHRLERTTLSLRAYAQKLVTSDYVTGANDHLYSHEASIAAGWFANKAGTP